MCSLYRLVKVKEEATGKTCRSDRKAGIDYGLDLDGAFHAIRRCECARRHLYAQA